MSHIPKVTAGNDAKKFWSKVKQSSKGFSSSFSNLSLHSETDGSTETDTVIHKALVNYYANKNLPFPEWLGVPEKRDQGSRNTNQKYSRQQQPAQQTQQYRPTYQPTRADNNVPVTQVKRTTDNSKYSLSDIYNKSNTDLSRTAATSQQQQQTQRYGLPARSATFNSSYSGEENNGSAAYSANRANSTSSNRLKERAQKQNKQSFDTYANYTRR